MFGCRRRRGLQQQLSLCYDMLVFSCPCRPVHPTLLQVVPRVKELANDSSQFVRAALAGVVMELAPQLGKQPTIEHLVPVFLNLLRDPYPDVRLNVISKLDQVKRGVLWCCPQQDGVAHSKSQHNQRGCNRCWGCCCFQWQWWLTICWRLGARRQYNLQPGLVVMRVVLTTASGLAAGTQKPSSPLGLAGGWLAVAPGWLALAPHPSSQMLAITPLSTR